MTGVLAEGVYRNARAGNPGLAWLYAVATIVSAFDLWVYGGNAVLTLHRWFS